MYKNITHAIVNFDVGCVMCHMYCVERLLLCTYSMHVTEFAYKCDKGILELNFVLQHMHHCYVCS